MRYLIVGLGSIGKRHRDNLAGLISDTDAIVSFDPDPSSGANYDYLPDYEIADAVVYICVPTRYHASTLDRVLAGNPRAVFIEKPLVEIKHEVPARALKTNIPIAVGYQYRFDNTIRQLKKLDRPMTIVASAGDNLVSRYGNTALETMSSHAIDYCLWINGPMEKCEVDDAGKEVFINIVHKSGVWSSIYCNINAEKRYLNIGTRRGETMSHVDISASNEPYHYEMVAWLNYLKTGDPGDLCTLSQALAVQRVMRGEV